MSVHRVGFDEEEDIMGAEDFIQDDSCGEEEGEDDVLEETIRNKYSQYMLTAAQETRLRARSAPTMGSPSSANQRKRSAERLSASRVAVGPTSPREEYAPSERFERPASRLQQEGPPQEELGWTSESRSPLATVDENNAAAFGSQQGSSEKGSPVASHSSGAAEQSPAGHDALDSAMSFLDLDLASSDGYFSARFMKKSASERQASRSDKRASNIASEGLLGMLREKRRSRTSRLGGGEEGEVRRPVVPPPPMELLSPPPPLPKTPGRKSGDKSLRRNGKKTASPATGVRERENLHPRIRETTLLNWKGAYADKVRRKLEVANGMNKDLNLPSEYRLTTVGSDHAVAVQVSTKVEKKWHAEEQTISVQSFLHTYSRLCKLHAARQRAERAPDRDGGGETLSKGGVPPSPGARNQAELVHALHETMMLCDTLSEQVSLLRGTQPAAHRISDHLSFAGV